MISSGLQKSIQNNAYMSCKVRKEDRYLLGFSWQRPHHNIEFFSNASLPFDLTSACYLFDQIADSLQLIMKHRGAPPTTTHYLDDFISISGSQHLTLLGQLFLRQVLKYMIQNQNLSGLLEFSSVLE